MNNILSSDLIKEFTKNKTGLIGIGILLTLVMISLIAAVTVPIDTFKQWNNPSNWISNPKTSMPIWVNYFVAEKIPEHVIIENPATISKEGEISVTSHQFEVEFLSDDFPNGFIYEFTAEYSGSPLLQIHVVDLIRLKYFFYLPHYQIQRQKLYIVKEFFQLMIPLGKIFKYNLQRWGSIGKAYQMRI